MIVVVNTKGGGGKTTAATHLLAPWVLSRKGKANVIEIDDQNADSKKFESSSVDF